ncbi:hypothetical protein KKF91_13145 [Myxococcota bacterium]|nr:hypothetical protein [Myxococcota bacterium]MBU1431482.1 hypothetical protein [Myxococcota bacterium]MBU1897631.1 hypothetical protein [Myxococcota bacterium]
MKQPISKPTRLVAYCRVPSVAQKIVLVNQREVLEEFVVANVELVPQKLDEALRKDKNATDS